jgi:hypothetical protein
MGTRKFGGIIAAVLLTAAGLSRAENVGRMEPLDGVHSAEGLSESRAGRSPLDTRDSDLRLPVVPQGDSSPRATAPFGAPLPPHQLTPAPVLPFNPNGHLMPAPTVPFHPPDPARAGTRAYPAPFSGSGRAGR